MLPVAELFAQLGEADKRGFIHTACPGCGRGKKHFALFVTEGGFLHGHCVACGYSLRQAQVIEAYLGKQVASPVPMVKPPKHRKGEPRWKAHAAEHQFSYSSAPDVVKLWQAYKPIPAEKIMQWGLGVGVLPEYSSQCQHRRLTLPITQNGQVVSWRSRSFECDCKKWLSPVGHPQLLYNGGRLGLDVVEYKLADAPSARSCKGSTLIIGENAIDARLVECLWCMPAVATLGVANWRREWTQAVKVSGAEMVLVAFDHDLPGNGGSTPAEHAHMIAEWKVKHQTNTAPVSRGQWLVGELLTAGVEAVLYKWGDGCKDLGELLKVSE